MPRDHDYEYGVDWQGDGPPALPRWAVPGMWTPSSTSTSPSPLTSTTTTTSLCSCPVPAGVPSTTNKPPPFEDDPETAADNEDTVNLMQQLPPGGGDHPGPDNNGEGTGTPARRSFHLSEEEIQGFLEAGWPQAIVDNVVEFCNYLEDVATEYGMEAVAWGGGAWIDSLTVANATVDLVQETIFRRLRGVPEARPAANATRGRLMVGWAGFQRVVSDFHQSLIAEGLREHWLPSRIDGDGRRLEDPPFVRGTRGDHDLWAQARARELARALVEQGRRDAMARRASNGGVASSGHDGAASSGDTVLQASGNSAGQVPDAGGGTADTGAGEPEEPDGMDSDDDGALMQVSLEEEERLHRHNVQNEARRHLRTLLLSLEHIQQRGEGPEYRWGVQQLLRAYTMADEVIGVFRDILQRRVSGGQPYFPIVREPPIGALRSRILAWMGEFRFMLTRALSEELLLQLQELGRVSLTGGGGGHDTVGRSPEDGATLASLLHAPERSRSRSPRGAPGARGGSVDGVVSHDLGREAGVGGLAAHAPVVGTFPERGASGAATTATSRGEVAGLAPHSDDEQSSVEGLRDGVVDDLDGPAVLPARDVGRHVLDGTPARGLLGSVSAEVPGRDHAGHPQGGSSVRGPLGGAPARLLHRPRRLPGDVGVTGDAASAVGDDSSATSVLLHRGDIDVPDAELAAPVSAGVTTSALHTGDSGCGDVGPVRDVGDLGATPPTASVPAAAEALLIVVCELLCVLSLARDVFRVFDCCLCRLQQGCFLSYFVQA